MLLAENQKRRKYTCRNESGGGGSSKVLAAAVFAGCVFLGAQQAYGADAVAIDYSNNLTATPSLDSLQAENVMIASSDGAGNPIINGNISPQSFSLSSRSIESGGVPDPSSTGHVTWEEVSSSGTDTVEVQIPADISDPSKGSVTKYYRYTYTKPADYSETSTRIHDTLNSTNGNKVLFQNISTSSAGGAIYNNINNSSVNIVADFIGNATTSNGGAINNSGSLGDINGDFIGNRTYDGSYSRYGGAIYNDGTIGNITGSFISNHITSSAGLVFGGAIYNGTGFGSVAGSGTIGNITADFIGNYIESTNQSARGGAIATDHGAGNIIGNFIGNHAKTGGAQYAVAGAIANGAAPNTKIPLIKGTFIGNYVEAPGASGGAIENNPISGQSGTATIDIIEADFIGNYALSNSMAANGGAIDHFGLIKKIKGDFIGNYTRTSTTVVGNQSMGGAICNFASSNIESIEGNFLGNYTQSLNTISHGGAISNRKTATREGGHIGTISGIDGTKGLFQDNYSKADSGAAHGGAICNDGTIDSIYSDFTNNYVSGVTAYGGAVNLHEGAIIDSIVGDFTGNRAEAIGTSSNYSRGGAISNEGTINSLTGTFKGNYITAAGSDYARGGAIYNLGTINIKNLQFIENYSSVQKNNSRGGAIYNNGIFNFQNTEKGLFRANYVKTTGGNAYGGAIYNDATIDGDINADFIGNYAKSNATTTGSFVQGGAIYNSGDLGYLNNEYKGGIVNSVFSKNYVEAGQVNSSGESLDGGTAEGGAIFNRGMLNILSKEDERTLFVENYAKSYTQSYGAYGGAIYNMANSTINTIDADFTKNYAQGDFYNAKGGAIFNGGIINLITGTFNDNYDTSQIYAKGGAIHNDMNGAINEIRANFNRNYVFSDDESVLGGAISNFNETEGKLVIGNITGDFTGNYTKSNKSYARGGAIGNYTDTVIATIGDISGVFTGNYAIAGSNNARGGAIFNNNANTGSANIGNISGIFNDNYVQSTSRYARGGAIYNYSESNSGNATISSISGSFSGNYAKSLASAASNNYARGGAIYNAGTITKGIIDSSFSSNYVSTNAGNAEGGAIWTNKNIRISNYTKQLFEQNYAASDYNTSTSGNAYGGAIYNNLAKIYGNASNELLADFTNNSVAAIKGHAHGGAIYNKSGGNIVANLKGDFTRNTATSSSGTAYGGAIFNSSSIQKITGNFTENYAKSASGEAHGGGIYNDVGSTIASVSGTFDGNYTQGTSAYGGAIYNAGTITDGIVDSNFLNNSVSATTGYAYGGAIFNTGTISGITNSNFKNNSISSETNIARGGAIYNTGTITNGIVDSNFISNSAHSGAHLARGGAIWTCTDLELNYTTKGLFKDNSAVSDTSSNTEFIQAWGGAIFNESSKLSVTSGINADFINNSVLSGGMASGGAILNTVLNPFDIVGSDKGWIAQIGNITGDFTGNNAQSTLNTVAGGAISNTPQRDNSTGIIGNITGTFTENYAKSVSADAKGGAIFNSALQTGSSIILGNIHADLSGNYAEGKEAYGGGIYNITNATLEIGNIEGDFTGNYAKASSGFAQGGAIANYRNSIIGDITGDFRNNYAISLENQALGGAIFNVSLSSIGNIEGDFIGNYAEGAGSSRSGGGAIFNASASTSIKDISGDFLNNHAKSETYTVQGGAILNITSATIGNITGNFAENYIETLSANGDYAYGGAIYNSATIGAISGNFTENYAKSASGEAHGGGIYNDVDSTIASVSGTFDGNYTQGIRAYGGAIYNAGTITDGIIDSSFLNNSVTATTGYAPGGAIYTSKDLELVNNIKGLFQNNFANSIDHQAAGGAIYNESANFSLQNGINADFINNSVSAGNMALGGAIANFVLDPQSDSIVAQMGNITGDFTGNSAQSLNFAVGGAIANSAQIANSTVIIGDINGNFSKNYVQASNSSAQGGAIWNYSKDNSVAKIGKISGTFTGNYAQSDNFKANGGAIFNYALQTGSSIILGNIHADFNGNYVEGNKFTAGGAIYSEGKDLSIQIGNIEGDFIGNFAKSLDSQAYGGAIVNDSTSIGNIEGDFIGNYAEGAGSSTSYGGAIVNYAGSIKNIHGDFLNNHAKSETYLVRGGAITNTANGTIGNITGNFVENYAETHSTGNENNYAYGGALHNRTGATIGTISGDFTENYAKSASGEAHGGGIYNDVDSTIASVSGTFDGNYTQGASAYGGAIYNAGTITDGIIDSSFLNNSVTATSGAAFGGAIYNTGTLKSLFADFIDNYAVSQKAANSSGATSTNHILMAQGGAIVNTGIIERFSGDSITFSGNYAKTVGDSSWGGAISNLAGTIGYDASGKYVGDINAAFTENYVESGLDAAYGGAILNSSESTSKLGKISGIEGAFERNHAVGKLQAQGGAIMNAFGTINNISADFTENYANSTDGEAAGGAIANSTASTGRIDEVNSNFTGNYTLSVNNAAQGGAIYNAGATMGNVSGNFENNYSQGGTYAVGGAISQGSTIGSISGDFVNNYAEGKTIFAYGGAIANSGTIQGNWNLLGRALSSDADNYDAIIGDARGFIGNSARGAQVASGGAIYNIGTINGRIMSNFTGNYSSASIGNAMGGAIYNQGTLNGSLIGEFSGNYAQSLTGQATGGAIDSRNGELNILNSKFIENYAKGATSAMGGAILTTVNTNITAKDGYTTEFTGNYIQNGEAEKAYQAIAVANNSATLTFRAEDDSRILLNDYIMGSSGYNVVLDGANTGIISVYNDIFNADVLAQNVNVDVKNGILHNYEFLTLDSKNTAKWSLDIDFASKSADTFTIGEGSTGILYIDNLNFLNGTTPSSVMKIQILKGSKTDAIQLVLNEKYSETAYDLGATSRTVDETVLANTNFDKIYHTFLETGENYGSLKVGTTETTNDSIVLNIDKTIWNGDLTEQGVLGDTLNLLANLDTTENRNFNYKTSSDEYIAGENIQLKDSGSLLNINGVSDGESRSILNLNNHSLNAGSNNTLNLENIELTNSLGLTAGTSTNINVSNVVLNSAITGETSSKLTISGSGATLNGKADITTELTEGTLKFNNNTFEDSLLTVTNGIVDNQDGKITSYIIDNLQSAGGSYHIDIDMTGETSDTYSVGSGSNGTILIDSINYLNGATPNKEFKIQILKSSNDNIQLALAESLKGSEHSIGTDNRHLYDTVEANTDFDHIYHHYLQSGIKYGKIDLGTTTTTNDSLKLSYDHTDWNGEQVDQGSMGDTLNLLANLDTTENRNFNYKTSSDEYIAGENIQLKDSGSLLNINGVSNGESRSILNLNNHSLNTGSDNTLNLKDIELTNSKGLTAGTSTNINVSNVVLNGAITGETSSKLTISGSGATLNGKVDITTELTEGTLKFNNNTFEDSLLTVTNGIVDNQDGKITSYIIDNLQAAGGSYHIDIDLTNETGDTYTIGENSSGVILIDAINYINGTVPDKEFKVQIIKGESDAVRLALSEELKDNDYYLGTIQKNWNDLKSSVNYDELFHNFHQEGDQYGSITLGTTTTKDDSLVLSIDETRWGAVESIELKDTLKELNQFETEDKKNFNFLAADNIYTVKDNIGITENSTLNVNGVANSDSRSTIDFDSYEGFNVGQNGILNVSNTKLTGTETILTMDGDKFNVNLKNTEIDGNIQIKGGNDSGFNVIDGIINGNVSAETNFDMNLSGNKNILNGKVENVNTNLNSGELVFNTETFNSEGSTLNANNGTIKLADNTIKNYIINELNSTENVSYSLDVDFSQKQSDTITTNNKSTGFITIDDINIVDEAKDSTIVQVLNTQNSNLQLKFGDNIITVEDVREKAGSTVYNDEKFIQEEGLALSSTNTQNDSIAIYKYKEYDTLQLINTKVSDDDRNFLFRTEDEYVVTEDLGITTKGNLNIIGWDKTPSVIDGNNHQLFELDNKTNLTLKNVTVKNASGENGAVINITNSDAVANIVNSMLKDNISEGKGGAIYSKGDVNIIANSGKSEISGNTASGYSNGIYIDNKEATLTLKAENGGIITTNDKISGQYGYNINLTGNSSGKIHINNNVDYANVKMEHIELIPGANDIFKKSDLDIASGTLNLINDNSEYHIMKNLTVTGNMKLYVDADLAKQQMDRLPSNTIATKDSFINVDKINLLSDTEAPTVAIPFAYKGFKDNVKYTGSQVLSNETQVTTAYAPIYKYEISYDNRDDMGYFVFARAGIGGRNVSENYNPAVLATSVFSNVGAMSTQNQTFNYAFQNSDNFMNMPSFDRLAYKNRNKFALAEGNFSPLFLQQDDGSVWVKTYSIFENVPLRNGPKVSNIAYGTLVGFDTELKEMKHGWDRVITGYIGYNGASQHYNGVDSIQNGGLLGTTLTLYKGNFFNATTLSAGATVGSNTTMYGNEDVTTFLTGIANKAGYNLELKDGKLIIQPNLLMSYTMVNTFDYTNAAGVRINSSPISSLQLAPGIKVIGNTKTGWQPYIGMSMVWDLMNNSKVTANDVRLPEMSVKPYVQYGVGIQKKVKDNFMAFGQAMVQNGGRNGISLTCGFRWALGKESNPDETVNVQNKTQKFLSYLNSSAMNQSQESLQGKFEPAKEYSKPLKSFKNNNLKDSHFRKILKQLNNI